MKKSISTSKPIILIGAGGHSKVIIELLRLSKYKIIGVVDQTKNKGELICGIPILGSDKEINNYPSSKIELVNAVGSIPGHNDRSKISNKFRKLGYSFPSIIHPSSIIASNCIIADGVQVMAGSILQPGVQIGLDSILNTGVIVDHDCIVGENCHLAPGVTLSGGVHIKNGVHIGTGSTIIQNKIIGANSIIAAASIVYRDVPENVTFMQVRNNTTVPRKG